MPGGSGTWTRCCRRTHALREVDDGAEELTKEDDAGRRNVLELSNAVRSATTPSVAISSLGMIKATAQVTVKGERGLFGAGRGLAFPGLGGEGGTPCWETAGLRVVTPAGAQPRGASWPSVVDRGFSVRNWLNHLS